MPLIDTLPPEQRRQLRQLRYRIANREYMRRTREARKLLCVGVDLLTEAGTCGRLVHAGYQRCVHCTRRRWWLLKHAFNDAEISISAMLEEHALRQRQARRRPRRRPRPRRTVRPRRSLPALVNRDGLADSPGAPAVSGSRSSTAGPRNRTRLRDEEPARAGAAAKAKAAVAVYARHCQAEPRRRGRKTGRLPHRSKPPATGVSWRGTGAQVHSSFCVFRNDRQPGIGNARFLPRGRQGCNAESARGPTSRCGLRSSCGAFDVRPPTSDIAARVRQVADRGRRPRTVATVQSALGPARCSSRRTSGPILVFEHQVHAGTEPRIRTSCTRWRTAGPPRLLLRVEPAVAA